MTDLTLEDLGWTDDFAAQLQAGEEPARVASVHFAELAVLVAGGDAAEPRRVSPSEPTGRYAVGDWVVTEGAQVTRRLDRKSLIYRRAAGEQHGEQLIAANVDTFIIVSSCNADFNPARLERYLALAASSGCAPLIVLTKADTTRQAETYRTRAEEVAPDVPVLVLNATDPGDLEQLTPWAGPGKTLALLGSSGVGKTTIQNALTGVQDATQGIREADSRGRHTTTSRAMRRTLLGGWLIDTPGMRSLGLTDAADGIGVVFADIEALIPGCKFRNCEHESEPGCAITAAVAAGDLDADRVRRWQKLRREDQNNTKTLAEARAKAKETERMYKAGKARGRAKRRSED